MNCACCNDARTRPGYRMFTLHCPYCVARGIQLTKKQTDSPQDRSRRCREHLQAAIANGLDEQQIRALAKSTERPLAPIHKT